MSLDSAMLRLFSRRSTFKSAAVFVASLLPSGSGPVAAAQNPLRGAVPASDFGARSDGKSDDTAAIVATLEAHDTVLLAKGVTVVENLSIPSGKSLIGMGSESVLRLREGSNARPLLLTGKHDILLENITLDAGGTGSSIALLTTCDRATLRNLWLTGSSGHGVELDNCSECSVSNVQLFRTGTVSSHAAIYLKNASGDGWANRVRGIVFEDIQGRGLFVLGNHATHIEGMRGVMTNGEILLLEESYDCVASDIEWRGPGPQSHSRSDGIAINGNCRRNRISSFNGRDSSGHAVSINGQSGKAGASDNVIANGIVISPNEGGVVITDQGVSGSVPARNTVSNVMVLNAGQAIRNPAFSSWGAVDSTFTGCVAEDNQEVPTTTYGFEDGEARNPSRHNIFTGRLRGRFIKARFISAHSSSVVREIHPD